MKNGRAVGQRKSTIERGVDPRIRRAYEEARNARTDRRIQYHQIGEVGQYDDGVRTEPELEPIRQHPAPGRQPRHTQHRQLPKYVHPPATSTATCEIDSTSFAR